MAITVCRTRYGPVRGLQRSDEDITEFRGIPYAKPPVGELRFMPPVEIEPWEGVKECTVWPPIAPQTFFDATSELYPYGTPEMSEDCLYINVYTPAGSENERYPVYVWYHDGGLTNGWSYDPRNDPTELVKRGIVVATVGHRLAEFGYMALPQLTEEQGQSGNYGAMDCVLALKWVKDNIAFFGGDPDCITIGAESGGTIKCAGLIALPELKGMVKRVISQSGLSWLYNPLTQSASEKACQGYLAEGGVDLNLTPEELRALPFEKIHIDMDPHNKPDFLTEDGVMYSGSFRDAFMSNLDGVDLLNCVCSGDAVIGADPALLDENRRISSASAFYTHFKAVLGDLYDKYNFEELVKVSDDDAWEKTVNLSSLGLAPNVRSNYCRSIMVDRIFGAKMAKLHPESRVYTVRFSQIQPCRTDMPALQDVAAPHGSDLWYSYGTLKKGIPVSRPWTEDDVKTSDMFIGYLANFIKTGDPNGVGLPEWKRGDESMSWLDLNASPECHTGMEGKLDELMYEHAHRAFSIEE